MRYVRAPPFGGAAIVRATIEQGTGRPLCLRAESSEDLRITLAPLLAVRLLRFAGTVIVTAVIVFLALLLAIRYLVFPSLDEYRGTIAEKLARRAGAAGGRSGRSPGGWDGWNPRAVDWRLRHSRSRAARGTAGAAAAAGRHAGGVDVGAGARSAAEGAVDRATRARDPPRCPGPLPRRRLSRSIPRRTAATTAFTDWLLRQREIVVRNALVLVERTSCAARRSSCSTT